MTNAYWNNCNVCGHLYNWINYNIKARGCICASCWIRNKREIKAKAEFYASHQGRLFE